MSNEELIARAQASLEGVTPGPFSVFSEWDVWTGEPDSPGTPLVSPDRGYRSWGRKISDEEHTANAHFFAASRQLVPDLIDALRAERERAERAEAMVAAAYRDAAETASRKAKFTKEAMRKATGAQIMANLVQFTESRTVYEITTGILARTPADAQAALDRMLQQATDEALERAAHWIESVPEVLPNRQEYAAVIRRMGRAMKGGAK